MMQHWPSPRKRLIFVANGSAGQPLHSHPNSAVFGVKHVVENWAGQKISNGALIVAAYQAGFEIEKPADEAGANVTLGLDATDLREFDCGCGHP